MSQATRRTATRWIITPRFTYNFRHSRTFLVLTHRNTMAKTLDVILVIDVESTCWEGYPPPGQMTEIIEVGLCLVDTASLERLEKRSLMVRPQKSTVSAFCTELTGITQEMAEAGMTLSDVVHILMDEYRAPERLFASWGDYDRNQFRRNCDSYGIPYPFGPTHLNVKNLFSIAWGLRQELGIDSAMERLGLTMVGRHHRGVDDAWNIAELLCLQLKRIRRTGI